MSSGLKRHRRVSPMPIVSSFPPPNLETVRSTCSVRDMTAEDWEKYGPKSDLKRNGKHYMCGGKKNG